MRIAGGEVLTRRQSFVPWLQGRAFDVVQPDVTKVGGISEERRIAWMALDNGVAFVPHGWNTALGLAADLQLASAIPGTEFVEYLTGSPYIDDIVAEPWQLDADGMLADPGRARPRRRTRLRPCRALRARRAPAGRALRRSRGGEHPGPRRTYASTRLEPRSQTSSAATPTIGS